MVKFLVMEVRFYVFRVLIFLIIYVFEREISGGKVFEI